MNKRRKAKRGRKVEPRIVELEGSEVVDLGSIEKRNEEETERREAENEPFAGAKGKDADEKAASRLTTEGWLYDEGREDFEGLGGHLKSPLSVAAIDLVSGVRRSLDALDIPFERKSRTRMYSAMYIIAPLPKTAYVYRFVVKTKGAPEEDHFIIDIYDMLLTHAGSIGMMEIDNLTKRNKQTVRKVLLGAIETLERMPWDFPLSIKWRHGLLIPEYGRAKRAWRDLGFDIDRIGAKRKEGSKKRG